jgi:hypothetical protein
MKDDLVDALIPVFRATVRPALLPKTRLNRSGWNTSINVRRAPVCNLCSIQTNQAAIAALFRVVNRYVGNLAPMPGVFPDYPAPVIRNTNNGSELAMMRWGMPPPLSTSGIRRHRTGAAGSSQRADAWCRSIALLNTRQNQTLRRRRTLYGSRSMMIVPSPLSLAFGRRSKLHFVVLTVLSRHHDA